MIKIEYDGTGFYGWQRQPERRTVQGEIEKILSYIAGEEVLISGTSRTDRGVHAHGQCASFKWENGIPTSKLANVMNRRLGVGYYAKKGSLGDIRIISAEEMCNEFHARYSCRGKTYKYIIDNNDNIFSRNYVFQLKKELNLNAMNKAAQYVMGTHDFKCFEAAGGTPRETTVRTISDLSINSLESKTIIEITGDGFLYNMVRIIVGTLVEIGIGEMEPDYMRTVIESCDRKRAGFTAPPQGLYLEKIYF